MKRILKNILVIYPVKFFTTTSSTVINLIGAKNEKPLIRTEVARMMYGIFFILLMFAGDRLLSDALQAVNNKSHFRFSRIYNQTAQSEIVLIGNSRGHTLYQPAIREFTGTNTINLSYNALPVAIANALVADYYDFYAPPKKLVIEVSMLNKTELNVINEFKLYIRNSERIRSVIQSNSRRTATAVSIVNLYSFNTELFHRSLYYLGKDDIDWILDKKINKGMVENRDGIESMTFEITDDRLKDLSSLVQKAKEKNTEVKLVLAPYYPAYRQKIANLNSFISTIESKTGLKVHDYSSMITADEFFSDYLHLNKNGSKLFISKLHQDGIL